MARECIKWIKYTLCNTKGIVNTCSASTSKSIFHCNSRQF